MKLRKISTVILTPTAPFNFDATFHKPDHFTSGDNYWETGTKWQTWLWGGETLGLKFINSGSVEKPEITLDIYASKTASPSFLNTLDVEIKYRYNLGVDLSSFYNSFSDEPVLGPIIEKWRGMRPGHPSSLYEYLIIGIVLQNARISRSIQMFRSLLETYGSKLEFDDQSLWCFWEPGRLADVFEPELRNLKVGYRAKSIKKIDDYFATGVIDEMDLRKKTTEMQMAELLKLYGVGPATVWYLLFDVFHHWDFFNHISPWEQKIYSKVFFDQNPENPVPVEKLLNHFERYGQYKQLAVHYIWEDLWWKRKNEKIPWLEKLIRM